MRGQNLGTVLATNLFWMVFAASEDLKIEVGPSYKIAAQIGSSTKLTCSVTGCESPSFSWRTQIDSPLGGKVQNEKNKSILTMNPVGFENEHSYLCTASCGSKKVERGIQVELYSFPRDPEIEMSGPLILGSPVTVTCKVPKVYPSERLEVTILKEGSHHPMEGQEIVENTHGSNLDTKGLKMIFTPTMEDMGKALTCEAKLPIDEMEFEPKERRTTQILQVNIVPKNTAISITPSNTVQEGDSVTMTCTSEGLPPPQIFWSKKQDGQNLSPVSENATLTLMATKREDSGTYVCEAKNQFGESRKEVEVTIQAKSLIMEVSPGPKISAQIGDSVVLTCTVKGCEAPLFSWRTQIDSPLWGRVHNEGTKSTLTMSPIGLENEHSYLCTASCGDRKVEKEVQVELYSFPRDPEIEMSGPLILGSPVTITCKVPKVYPSERLEMTFLKEGSHHPMEGQEIVENTQGSNLDTKGLKMIFTPTMEDMGKALTCEAKLPIDEMEFEPKERRTTQILQVAVLPKDTSLTAFPSDSVKEGDSVTISCTSGDVPKSQIILRKKTEWGDTELESTAGTYIIHAAQLEDAGMYECESKTEGGSEFKSLMLDVKVPPRNTTISIHPSRTVHEGENVTITCKTFSHPPAVIVLKRVDLANEVTMCSKNGTFTLYHVTADDTGLYVIDVSNEVGKDSGQIEISVMKRADNEYFSPQLLALYCLSSLVIPATGMVIYFARKANHKGSYSLVDALKSKV